MTRAAGNRGRTCASLTTLGAIFDYLDRFDIRMYRMATALAPYASHPELPRFHHQVEECAAELVMAGEEPGVSGFASPPIPVGTRC